MVISLKPINAPLMVIPGIDIYMLLYYVKRVVSLLYSSVLSCIVNRDEKSFRHVAMVAKFLDDNKPKTSLKK